MPKHGINRSEIQDLKWRRLPPSLQQWRLFTRLYLHDLRSGSGRTLHYNSGQAWILTLARPLSPMSRAQAAGGGGWGAHFARFWSVITFIGRWQSFNLNTLSQQQPCSVSVMAPGACTLDTGHCPVTLFCAEDTRGSQRAPPPDITLTVCNCISREVAQISAQSFALISFHKNPSPFWLFLWLFYAAWFRAGRAWRLESTQVGFRIESQPHPTIKLF